MKPRPSARPTMELFYPNGTSQKGPNLTITPTTHAISHISPGRKVVRIGPVTLSRISLIMLVQKLKKSPMVTKMYKQSNSTVLMEVSPSKKLIRLD